MRNQFETYDRHAFARDRTVRHLAATLDGSASISQLAITNASTSASTHQQQLIKSASVLPVTCRARHQGTQQFHRSYDSHGALLRPRCLLLRTRLRLPQARHLAPGRLHLWRSPSMSLAHRGAYQYIRWLIEPYFEGPEQRRLSSTMTPLARCSGPWVHRCQCRQQQPPVLSATTSCVNHL
jgi:hypothetical protein